MSLRTARCCCGALSIRTRGEPVFNGVCHCADCRRRTGSAFGWSCYFGEDAVEPPQGPWRTYLAHPPAGGEAERGFCPDCGSTLFWRASAFPGLVGLAAGAFTDPPLGEPTVSTSDSRRCAWFDPPAAWIRMA